VGEAVANGWVAGSLGVCWVVGCCGVSTCPRRAVRRLSSTFNPASSTPRPPTPLLQSTMPVRACATRTHTMTGQFDGSLALLAARILPWAVLLHLMMGVWSVGAPDVTYATAWPPGEGTVRGGLLMLLLAAAVTVTVVVAVVCFLRRCRSSEPLDCGLLVGRQPRRFLCLLMGKASSAFAFDAQPPPGRWVTYSFLFTRGVAALWCCCGGPLFFDT
jgi:hypothetical protein